MVNRKNFFALYILAIERQKNAYSSEIGQINVHFANNPVRQYGSTNKDMGYKCT